AGRMTASDHFANYFTFLLAQRRSSTHESQPIHPIQLLLGRALSADLLRQAVESFVANSLVLQPGLLWAAAGE
ncbi:hypothetical protein, partial [Azospirillum argentinense]